MSLESFNEAMARSHSTHEKSVKVYLDLMLSMVGCKEHKNVGHSA
jgi:hypothetical protein